MTPFCACENCGRVIGRLEVPQVYADHVVCTECWRHLSSTGPPTDPRPAAGAGARNEFACPLCGSTNVISAAAAYEQGTTTSKAGHVAFAFSNDGVVPVLGGSSGVQHSLVAQKLAPPKESDRAGNAAAAHVVITGVCLLIALIAGVGNDAPGAGLVGVLVVVVISGLMFAATAPARKREAGEDATRYEDALRVWQATWYCAKCGRTFTAVPKTQFACM